MKLVLWVTRRPWPTIVSMVLLTLAAALGLERLELRMDGHALVPPDDPAVVFDEEVREHFAIRDSLIVLLESSHPAGIYNPDTLRRLEQLSRFVLELEDVAPEHVMSLATERRDRVYPGTLKFRPFLDPFPENDLLMEHFKGDVAAAGILTGTLVSADGQATAILVGVPPEGDKKRASRDRDGRAAFYHRLVAETRRFESETDRVTVVGAPAAEALLGRHVLKDLVTLVPLAMGLMALILALRLRRFWGLVLGFAEIGACLLFTFGLMGWLGFPIYLTTAVLPVVLITLGLADEIHVFHHYQLHLERCGEAGSTARVVESTMKDMLPPVTLTSLTSGIGFLSFSASPIEPVRAFGLFAAVGIFFCLLWSVTVIPAALALLPAERLRRGGASPARSRIPSTPRVLAPFLRSPRATLTAIVLVSLAMGYGVWRLEVQDSWIEGFAPDSPFRRQTEHVDAKLYGTHVLLVHLETAGRDGEVPRGDGKEGWLLDPALLNEIGAFEDYLRGLPGVGGVLGPYSHLSTVAHMWMGRKEGTRRIPDDALRVARVVRFFDVVRGKHRRLEVIDEPLNRALITIFLKNANYQETKLLVEKIRACEERFTSQRVRLELAGDVAVSQAMIPAIVRSQVSSLLIALAGALVTLCVLFRSLRLAGAALLPVLFSVLWTFGAMGWLGVPLGVATSMFCAITLGVGVDYAIHFLESFRRAGRAGREDAVHQALGESAPPIVTDMLAIAGSFGLLAVSQVPANARLGILVAITLTAACFLTLTGLGIWLSRPWVPEAGDRPGRASSPSAVATVQEIEPVDS